MGNSNRKLKKIQSGNFPLSFNDKVYNAKVLEITSCSKCKVIFKYKGKYTTWNVSLNNCYDTNLIVDSYQNNAKEFLRKLLNENNYLCKLRCGVLQDGYINVEMYVKKQKKSINHLIIDSGYNGQECTTFLPLINTDDKLITDIENINYEQFSPKLMPIKEEKIIPNLLMKYETMDNLLDIDKIPDVQSINIEAQSDNNTTNIEIIDVELSETDNLIDKETQVEEYQLQRKNYLEKVEESKEKKPYHNELMEVVSKLSFKEI